MVNHRGPEFAVLQNSIIERLKKFYKTDNDVLIVTAAGTGGLESAIVSFLSPGDKVLAVTIGAFGDRFAKIATVYGADVTKLAFDWGKAADPAKVREALKAGGPWKAVLMTQNETSTAVTNPIAELAKASRKSRRTR
jgi:aspartate aminotransferase-like enzyme